MRTCICKAKIADESIYVLGLDCPPGIYRWSDRPPDVVFRLHPDQLIRREAEADAPEGAQELPVDHDTNAFYR